MKTSRTNVTILIPALLTIILWYFDVFHKPVETVNNLIGKDYAYAFRYFGSKPADSTTFSINDDLNEFQRGILSVDRPLKDSIIHQHTWEFRNYKITIWTAGTAKSENEIIDAIRYKNSVRF